MSSPSPEPRRRSRSVLLVAGLLLGAVGVVLLLWRPWRGATANFGYDPQAVYPASPFRNAKPGVRYVGDAVCAECHRDVAESFRHHPMGQSLALVKDREPIERLDPAGRSVFERIGLEFSIAEQDGRMMHRAVRRGPRGEALVQADAEIAYVMGSGRRGRSYLLERDGYLFQSPASWFTQKQAWDLSPGFEVLYPPERVIEPVCLFCHSNLAEPVEHARNRYAKPVFRGLSIGCERCHGPGELHVELRRATSLSNEPIDYTIVNPKHLSPELRESVCQQCHLQGERRLERAGRKTFDYRPGLPLHEFWAVFVSDPQSSPTYKAVGQVEQMHESQCFRGSGGKLGCISCHDPHAVPAAEDRADFYRGRCLSCHAGATAEERRLAAADAKGPHCSMPLERRSQLQPDNNCIACHMPRFKSSDIAHTAVTNHRVPRLRKTGTAPPVARGSDLPFVSFFARQCPPGDARADRDLGVALAYLANQPDLRMALSARALPLLESATRHAPADVPAWEALAWTLGLQGRHEEALDAYEKTLELAPERELALSLAASLAASRGRHDDARTHLRRLVKVNPWIAEYRLQLARLLGQKQQWTEALTEAEMAVKLNPTHHESRKFLVTCCVQTGRTDEARRQIDLLVAMNPREEKALRELEQKQKR